MNREKLASCVLLRIVVLTAGAGLSGCQDWMAEPVRVEQHYGESVRIAMANQLYDPNRALHPATEAPEGLGDGLKSVKVLQRTYQVDLGSPQRVRQLSILNVQGAGGGGGGQGGGGGGGMQ